MDFLKNLFRIKEDAQPVDVITGGKELRERQEDLQTGVGGVTEELMKQNPELFNNADTGGGGGGTGIMDLVNQGSSFLTQPLIADKFSIGNALTLKGALSGNPLSMLGLGVMALQNLPEESPEQKAMRKFYKDNFGITDSGKVASGIMAGYNPIYRGGAGLQRAYDRRIATIMKTLATKYKDGNYDDTLLDERLEKLREEKRKEQEALQQVQTQINQSIKDDANQRFRDDPGAASYSGGFDSSTNNYFDPFDPGETE